jgi:crotonobetainyl-CoA:carnitine CoA-transferase CaiB-like acyl-CoA transferase
MTEESIFDQATPDIEEPQIAAVSELVGADKKYKSVEDALKSIPHAQSHIQKLEEEAAQLREELTKRRTTEELLDELKATGLPEKTTQASFDSETLVKAVEGVLSQREEQKRSQQNIESVVSVFNTQFGEKGPEMYKKVAEESGLPLSALNNLAARSPSAVLKLAGITQVPQAPGKTTSTVNTEAFKPTPSTSNIRVKPVGASTKDLVAAWKAAGEGLTS